MLARIPFSLPLLLPPPPPDGTRTNSVETRGLSPFNHDAALVHLLFCWTGLTDSLLLLLSLFPLLSLSSLSSPHDTMLSFYSLEMRLGCFYALNDDDV